MTMRSTRRLLVLLATTSVLAALPAAPAAAKLQIGISEQNANMFDSKYFKPLKIKYARIVVPWNIMKRKDYWPGYLKAWLAGAKRRGVEPHVAFNIIDVSPKYFGKGPTPKQYFKMAKAFHKKYPQVKSFAPWNEENHKFQPTAKLTRNKGPKLAAAYYKALRRACPKCKILAADTLGDANLKTWIKRFRRYYKGAGTWGIHNYQDGNKPKAFRKTWTYLFTKMVRGKIWSTEAGGIVGFKTVSGRVAYKYNPKRALRAQKRIFKLMNNRKVRKRYQRVYIYNWHGSWTKKRHTNRWDSGLIALNGKPRPTYYDLKKRTH
jgi:hypothetical protein